MPPRISGTRVTHIYTDGKGKKQAVNPSPRGVGFGEVVQGVARRQKVPMGAARMKLTSGGHAGHGGH